MRPRAGEPRGAPVDGAVRRLGESLWPAFAAGAAAQIVQAVSLREILQVARGGETVLGFTLFAWLAGTGLGAALWRGPRVAAAILVATLPPATLLFVRALPVPPGTWNPAAGLAGALAAFAPGAYFATLLRRLPPEKAVALEALGACAAGALLTLALFRLLGSVALLAVAGAACLAASGRAGAVAAALLVAMLPLAGRVERATLEAQADAIWPGSRVAAWAETPGGRLTWLARGPQHALFANGSLAATSPDEIDAEALAHVALAAHPAPGRLLLLGGFAPGVLRECLRHPVRRAVAAIGDRAAVDLALGDLPDADRAALGRAELVFGDPRRAAARGPWDVVLLLAGEPSTLAWNRFYTAEFFASVDLAPGGILLLSLPGAAHERESEVLARNVSVWRALAPLRARVLPGATDLLVAAAGAPPDLAPATLLARLGERGIALRHHAQDFFAEPFAAAEVERATAAYRDYPLPPPPAVPFAVATAPPAPAPPILANRDLHPGAVLHSAAALARREGVPWLARATAAARAAPLLLLALAALGALLAWRRGPRAAHALAAATAGAGSMGLWIVILLAHQARVGALYGEFALLAACFMGGFAGGARLRLGTTAADALFLAVCVLVAAALPHGARSTCASLSVAAGAAGGASLSGAIRAGTGSAARLYASDLLGGALASLLFGTFLVPALGAFWACATAAGAKAFSLAGGLLARRR